MESRISQIKSGPRKDLFFAEIKKDGKWKAITMPCKTEKTCKERRTRWLAEREKERAYRLAQQVMALPWKDVYIQVDF